MTEDYDIELFKKLDELRVIHRKLDREIDVIVKQTPHDQFSLFSLKKKKLAIRDEIMSIEDIIYPNIIA